MASGETRVRTKGKRPSSRKPVENGSTVARPEKRSRTTSPKPAASKRREHARRHPTATHQAISIPSLEELRAEIAELKRQRGSLTPPTHGASSAHSTWQGAQLHAPLTESEAAATASAISNTITVAAPRPHLPAPETPAARAREERPDRPDHDRRLFGRRQLAVASAVALLLAALLNAASMQRAAQVSPFGWRRDVSLAILAPFVAVSQGLGLDRPRALLDSAVGHSDDANSAAAVVAPPPEAIPPSPPATVARPSTPVKPVATAPKAAPPRERVHLRRPTPVDPLRVWSGGDSVEGFLGFQLANLSTQAGDISVQQHYQVSGGLTRPDFYDWPAHLRTFMAQYDPEVVVLLVGANDTQALMGNDGKVHDFGSTEWRGEYSRRAAQVMDEVTQQGRLLIWVGQPVMRSPDFDSKMKILDGIYRDEARSRPSVIYFDSAALFGDAHGHYTAYLPDSSGASTLMRAQDGIHLTSAGGLRLASAVMLKIRELIAEDDINGKLRTPPPPPG